jgi:type II secretory pathway predicted ATPase ExeA
VTLDRVQRALADDPQRILLWLDEAHDLSEDTLAQARALAESDLEGATRVQVLLAGLPKLRAMLQEHPPLWRRIVVREEIAGLAEDELPPFLDHHFEGNSKRLCDRGLHALFERAKGAPGVVIPMYRAILSRAGAKGKIEAERVEESLDRWDLP